MIQAFLWCITIGAGIGLAVFLIGLAIAILYAIIDKLF